MPRRPKLEDEIEGVAALRSSVAADAEIAEKLRKALCDRRALLAGKAAEVAVDRGFGELEGDVDAALGRFLDDVDGGRGRETDPGCLGKTALAKALADLGADRPESLRRGMRCVQLEPVWGGEVDAAAELRGVSAIGLAGTRDPEVEVALTDLLADPEPAARSGAVRGLAGSGRIGASLVLRLEARLGDEDPGVLLDTFSALLEIEPRSGLEPIRDALADWEDEVRFEAAAIALASSRRRDALGILAAAERREAESETGDRRRFRAGSAGGSGRASEARRSILLRAIGLLRHDEALGYLLDRLEAAAGDASPEREVLADLAREPRLRGRLREIAGEREGGQRALEALLAGGGGGGLRGE